MSKHHARDGQVEDEDLKKLADAKPQQDEPDTTESMAEADDAPEDNLLIDVDRSDQDTPQPGEQTDTAQQPKPRISALPDSERTTTGGNKLQRFLRTKKLSIPTGVVLVILLLAAIPFTRYALAGTVLKQAYKVTVVDTESKKPITSALVELAGKKVKTDSKGQATLQVPVGQKTVTVSKKYYKGTSLSVTVPLMKQKDSMRVALKATGRQIPISVINIISKKPVADILVKAGDAEAKTDKQGRAILVVSASKKTIDVSFTGKGYAALTQNIPVNAQYIQEPTYKVTPAGKIYFLSNASGKIDVVKTNLDGTDRQVVLAGTGKEDKYGTSLLASRDWKYLALSARRDSDQPKLYLIDTSSDKLTTMDEGDASFNSVGWSGHYFIYTVSRNNVSSYDKQAAIKSYNAEKLKITTLAENELGGKSALPTGGSIRQELGGVFIFDKEILYTRSWYGNTYYAYGYNYPFDNGLFPSSKTASLNSVQPDGGGKKVIKSYERTSSDLILSLSARAYAPQELYLSHSDKDGKQVIEEYENGQVKLAADQSLELYGEAYPTYLISPSGSQSFWTDYRDGKQMFSLGDKAGHGGKQIATLDKYNTYGWYTDDYLLFSKNSSELYIAPAGNLKDESTLLKVSNYYKPGQSYEGYGYGYGGL